MSLLEASRASHRQIRLPNSRAKEEYDISKSGKRKVRLRNRVSARKLDHGEDYSQN
jgi:hypothetical protein